MPPVLAHLAVFVAFHWDISHLTALSRVRSFGLALGRPLGQIDARVPHRPAGSLLRPHYMSQDWCTLTLVTISLPVLRRGLQLAHHFQTS